MVANTRRDEVTKFCWKRMVTKRSVAPHMCSREAAGPHAVFYFCAGPYCNCHWFTPSGEGPPSNRPGKLGAAAGLSSGANPPSCAKTAGQASRGTRRRFFAASE